MNGAITTFATVIFKSFGFTVYEVRGPSNPFDQTRLILSLHRPSCTIVLETR